MPRDEWQLSHFVAVPSFSPQQLIRKSIGFHKITCSKQIVGITHFQVQHVLLRGNYNYMPYRMKWLTNDFELLETTIA